MPKPQTVGCTDSDGDSTRRSTPGEPWNPGTAIPATNPAERVGRGGKARSPGATVRDRVDVGELMPGTTARIAALR
ncbi:hypothetical protein NUM_50410 [Actinocatenispora comari]|uniref:Uncharacterized protein n=1 Tax=Actinocatenispora comari TaxID=2807577 RepID=A0A8J4AHG5_9ACTN|nr:hypothetical protein NUM_50410 [Actinocatenispora comari]